MSEEPFVERTFTINGAKVICRFFKPVADRGDFYCRYEFECPSIGKGRKIYGVDEVQALLLAMETAHLDLLMIRKNEGAEVAWLDMRRLGLPIMDNLRDLDA